MPARFVSYTGLLIFALMIMAGCTTVPQKSVETVQVNSLGMRFVALPDTMIFISIWETRVQDFEQFAEATSYNDNQGVYSLSITGWKRTGASWRALGFQQGPQHPICGVGRNDAKAFCGWLTQKERAAGLIRADQEYRLPTDAEWSVAAGLSEDPNETPANKDVHVAAFMPGSTGTSSNALPWGTAWPPPENMGNYAGIEADDDSWPVDWKIIEGYRDAFPRTAPVGSFPASPLGLFDLSGNAAEWCEDDYRRRDSLGVLRGGSYISNKGAQLLTADRADGAPTMRYADRGFRCVLAPVRAPQEKSHGS